MQVQKMAAWRFAVLAVLAGWLSHAAWSAELPPSADAAAQQEAKRLNALPPVGPTAAGHIDRSGRTERGGASYYSRRFSDRKMADGRRMNPNSDVAASKTLPLGSVAKVKNLENDKSATVKVEDRGPYVKGRVMDLAPKVADDLSFKEKGVVPVEVKPITVPRSDGGVKLGAGAAEATSQEVQQAIETTRQLTESKGAKVSEK
jgi:rare lipoprotein A